MARTERRRIAWPRLGRRAPFVDTSARDRGCSSTCGCHAFKRVENRRERHQAKSRISKGED